MQLPYSGPRKADASSVQRITATQKRPTASPELSSSRSPQPGSASVPPNKPLPLAPDLMIPARQASRAKLAQEQKLRRRSLDLLREEEEKAKATQVLSGRKASMAEKVRSVTNRGSAQALSSKTKSPKQTDTRSSAPSKVTSPPTKSPKPVERDTAARSPTPMEVEERSNRSLPQDQPIVAVELPAEVPRDGTGRQEKETTKKGGLQLHLGSKHRSKEHGSGPSPARSLNPFRRSPQPPQSPGAPIESHITEVTTPSPKRAETFPTIEHPQQAEAQLSPPSVPSPRRSSPDPGLPSPPALAHKNFAPGVEPNSYTALPNILATAQRAKTVKAALRVSVPAWTDPESQKTPRAIPSQPLEAVHTQVTLAELPPSDSKLQAMTEDESKHTSYQSSLGEPGPEVRDANDVQASKQQSTSATEDEKTPTTSTGFRVEIPTASSTVAQEARGDPLDTPLTSATMRSYSDFCKLPPQRASSTPPPATPEGSVRPPSVASASGVASPIGYNKSSSVQETEREGAPSRAQPGEDLSPRKRGPVEKKSANVKDLRLKPRNKDLQNQSELLDLIASTPPQSPIHTRGSSEASALNGVGKTSSTSRILAPPEEAPPPPAPGGRSMIIPDYAAAGAFEGERKSKRSSGMSTAGWKKMFASSGGAGAPAASTVNTTGGVGTGGSQVEDEEVHMSANLMGGQGNDVLWYKGMGRDGLWVSGA